MAKIGDTAVCINYEGWEDEYTFEDSIGPYFKQVLIITSIHVGGYLGFDEYPGDDNVYEPHLFVIIENKTESITIKLESKKVLEKEKIISN